MLRRNRINRVLPCVSHQSTSMVLLLTLHFCWLSGMTRQASGEAVEPSSSVAISPSERIAGIRPEILNRAGLRMVWPYDGLLSVAEDRVIKLFYHHGQLFVLSQDKILYALDGKNGTINWTKVLSQYEMDNIPVSFYDDVLVMIFGNSCVEIREPNGEIVRETAFNFDVMTSAVRSDDRLFVGSRNQRFYAIRRRDGIPLWQTVCQGRPTGAVAILNNLVYFTARDNTLYVSLTDKRQLIWSAPAVGELCGVVVDQDQCLMPSQDTTLYCLEPRTGRLLWKVRTGGALTVLPTVTKKWAYQPVSHKSLLCIDREKGAEVWDLPKGRHFLAQNGSDAYVMTDDSELTHMDNKAGRRLSSIFVHRMDYFAQNNEDATIFMCSAQGHILALEPVNLAPLEMEVEAEEASAEPGEETEEEDSFDF